MASPGWGKTTFAANADCPAVIATEDGLNAITVPHFPLAKSFEKVMEALAALSSEANEVATVVID